MQPNKLQSDEQLFSLVKAGNHLAFQTIYNKYWLNLFGNTYNILQDKALSEDVLHEVFTDIWLRRDVLEIQHLKGYLYKAVRNNALLKIKKERLESINNIVTDHLTILPEVELDLNQDDLKLIIDQAIDELPVRCKEIFYMSRYQHYSIAEIASHYNISNRTVENQIYRALKHLRSVLETASVPLVLIKCFEFLP